MKSGNSRTSPPFQAARKKKMSARKKAVNILILCLSVVFALVGSGMVYGYSILNSFGFNNLEGDQSIVDISEEPDELVSGVEVVSSMPEMELVDGQLLHDPDGTEYSSVRRGPSVRRPTVEATP